MLTESGDEEESDNIISKVLDEIGIEISGKVCLLESFWCDENFITYEFQMSEAPNPLTGKIGENSKSVITDNEIEAQLAKLRS